MESDALTVLLRNFLNVLLVLAAHHDVGDAGALCGKNLFLDATHRKHLSPQCYLTRHGRVLTHLTLCYR